MEQNDGYYFGYEPEILEALGAEKVGQIKGYHLERIFDDLYDYYVQHSDDEVKNIQEAYDMIFSFRINVITDQMLNALAIYIFNHLKDTQKNENPSSL